MDTLPVETVENILGHLQVPDISSLRLSCHALNNALCRTSRLRRIFRRKTIRFSTPGLEQFTRVTDHPGMACLLEHCAFVGIAAKTDVSDAENVLGELLTRAFRNLRKFGRQKALKSLSFTMTAGKYNRKGCFVVAKSYNDRYAVWDTAPYVWHKVVDSLVAAELEVQDQVDLYSDQKICSITYTSFLDTGRKVLDGFNPFQRTKQLHVSLCAPLRQPKEDGTDYYSHDGRAERLENPPPIATLGNLLRGTLSWMQGLKSVDMHRYEVGSHWEAHPTNELRVPVDEPALPSHHLKELKLRGFITTTQTLRKVVQATTPECFFLTYMFLVPDGTWDDVLSFLASSDVASYRLEDVFHLNRLVHFDAPGSPKFPYLGRELQWPSILHRQGEQVRAPVECRTPTTRPLGSGKVMRWRKANMRDYGPDAAPYNLMEWLEASPDDSDAE